jgi:hypothetical protein
MHWQQVPKKPEKSARKPAENGVFAAVLRTNGLQKTPCPATSACTTVKPWHETPQDCTL